MRPRNINTFVTTILERAEDYSREVPDDANAKHIKDILSLVREWCITEFAQVNYLLSHRRAQELQVGMTYANVVLWTVAC
jgi:hypothetical protein